MKNLNDDIVCTPKMHSRCVWIDILDKSTCPSSYVNNLACQDYVFKQNIACSIRRLLQDGDAIVLHFDNMDISVVRPYDICENPQLKKALGQARECISELIETASNESLLDISYKIDNMLRLLKKIAF